MLEEAKTAAQESEAATLADAISVRRPGNACMNTSDGSANSGRDNRNWSPVDRGTK